MGRNPCDATAHVSGSKGAVQRRRTDCRPSRRAKLDYREQWRVQRWQRLRALLDFGVVDWPEVRTKDLRLSSGRALPCGPATAGLRQREGDRADGDKQKQVKRASNKICLNGRIDLFFHGAVPLRVDVRASDPMRVSGGANMWRARCLAKLAKARQEVFYNFLKNFN